MHRFAWDVHYQPLAGLSPGDGALGAVPAQLPIQAIPYNTVPAPTTPWVNPGTYTVKLTVEGKSYTQPIVVKQDPRVKTPALAMPQVYTLTRAMYYGAADARIAATKLGAVRQQIAKLRAQGAVAQALAAFGQKVSALEGTPPPVGGGRGGRGGGGGGGAPDGRGGPPVAPPIDTLWAVSTSLGAVMNAMQAADVAPTAKTLAAVTAAQQNAARVLARWNALRTVDLPALNAQLKSAGIPALTID